MMRWLAGTVLLALGVPAASGQARVSVDLGAVTARYADSLQFRATTVAPTLHVEKGSFTGGAATTLSMFEEAGWSTQGRLWMSLLSPPIGALRAEVLAEGAGSTHEDGTRIGSYVGGGRLLTTWRSAGVWAGVAGGRAWDESQWRMLVQGDGGIWMRRGSALAQASVRPMRVGDVMQYTDMEGLLALESTRLDVVLGGGIRAGDAVAVSASDRWASAAATVWLTRTLGISGAFGTSPADFVQITPQSRFVSLSIRLASGRLPHDEQPSGLMRRSPVPIPPGAPRLEVRAEHPATVIRVHAPNARSVEILGDLTGWAPLELRRQSDAWMTTAVLSPGAYQVLVRVNGASWMVPAGISATRDEFGLAVGVVDVR